MRGRGRAREGGSEERECTRQQNGIERETQQLISGVNYEGKTPRKNYTNEIIHILHTSIFLIFCLLLLGTYNLL